MLKSTEESERLWSLFVPPIPMSNKVTCFDLQVHSLYANTFLGCDISYEYNYQKHFGWGGVASVTKRFPVPVPMPNMVVFCGPIIYNVGNISCAVKS